MEKTEYSEVLNYLENGIEPKAFNSTRGNFLAKARKYDVNKNGFLTRNGKIVVTSGEMEFEIYEKMHRISHAGRTNTWKIINQR